MYLVIFMFFAVFATNQSTDNSSFKDVKPKVAIVNRDDSIFSVGLVDYIAANTDLVEIKDSDMARKEAIYFQTASYIYEIPDNFGDDVFAGKSPIISTMQIESSDAAQARMLAENYIRLAGARIATGMSQAEVVAGIKEDLSKANTTVDVRGSTNTTSLYKVEFFYNFTSYVVLALCTTIISTSMIIFTSRNIKRRNYISPLSYEKITGQLFLGNSIFVLGIWLLFVSASCILYPDAMFTLNGLLYALNLFVFSILALSIGFIIGNFIKSKNAVGGITNVIALGSSFLCGVFVPQQFLGESVLNIARFIPSFWYVKSNSLIYKLSDFEPTSISAILINMLIILGFAVVIFIVTIVSGRIKQKEQ